MGHARDSSVDLAALARARRPPRARRPADRARCDRGHAAAPALPPGLRHRPAGRALRSLQSRSLSGSCCDHRENPRIPCGTPLPLSYWMRASRTAPRRLLRRTKTGSPAHLPADSSFRPRAALSRQPSLKAMSGMPPGEAAAWWCAYDQSVLRDLDRDVFDDHGPAHFHARHAQGSAKVRIDSLEVIETTLPRRQLRFVLAWAELHQDELRENWRRARAGETLQPIDRSDDWPDPRHHRGHRDPPRRSATPLRRWAERPGGSPRQDARTGFRPGAHPGGIRRGYG